MPRRKIDYYAAKAVRGDDDIMYAAWDVETAGLGGKLLSMQYVCFDKPVFDCSENMVQNFFNYIKDYPSPVVWYAHFAQYDWRYIMDYIVDNQIDCEIGMRTETDVYEIRLKIDGKKIVMRDSFALWNSPLEKLADSFCPEIPKLKIDIENYDPTNPEHIAYALRDVVILKTGLPRLNKMLNKHFNVNPTGTFAGTAMKAWQVQLPKDAIYNSSKWDAQEAFIRQAYYGGIVFLTTTNIIEGAETIDINSSYPAAMCKYGVPHGRIAESKDYIDGKMGIYHCRVKAPDNLIIPILPARDAKGNMRWFRGEFDTVVTNRELVFAAKHGYEIKEIYSGIVFEETIFPFNDFIGKCKTIRKEFALPSDAPQGTAISAEETLAKFMQNALYGKFGSRRERMRLLPAHCMNEIDLMNASPYDTEGKWYVQKEIDETMRCMPHWAVFITAHARLTLLQAAYTAGPENVIYGDTDSLTIKSGYLDGVDIGNEYGQWKLEKHWREFRAIAPKVYSGILRDGRRKGAAKGMPRKGMTDNHWRELLEDGQSSAQALSLQSLKIAIKNGMKPAHTLLRKSSTLTNSSNYEQLQNGNVRVKIAA